MNRESNPEKLVPRRSWFNYANRGRGIVPPNVTHLRLRATLSINEIESVQFLPPTIKTASRVSPRSSDQFFRVRMRKLKSKFRVSSRPFVPSKFNNIPRSLEFPFFRVSRGICPGIARFKPGQRRSKNHATTTTHTLLTKSLIFPAASVIYQKRITLGKASS